MRETIDQGASQDASPLEAPSPARPFWEVVAEISAQISDEEWTKIPADASLNPDRYLYGTPLCHLALPSQAKRTKAPSGLKIGFS